MTSRAPQKNSLKIDRNRILQSKLGNLPGFLWNIQARYYTNNIKVIANHVLDGKNVYELLLKLKQITTTTNMSSGNYITLHSTGGKFN